MCVFNPGGNGIGTLLGRCSRAIGKATRPTTDSCASFRQRTNCESHRAFNANVLDAYYVSGKRCEVSTTTRTRATAGGGLKFTLYVGPYEMVTNSRSKVGALHKRSIVIQFADAVWDTAARIREGYLLVIEPKVSASFRSPRHASSSIDRETVMIRVPGARPVFLFVTETSVSLIFAWGDNRRGQEWFII